MSNYGRNFEFRASPHRNQRQTGYVLKGTANLPIGVPVVVDDSEGTDSQGRLSLKLATGTADKTRPKTGFGGIVIYEHAPWAFSGVDSVITTYSDIDFAPVGESVQLVSGDDVVVAYTNTSERDFYTRTDYPKARVMVAGVGATLSVSIGDYLTPGVGDDTDGYWAVTASESEAWLKVLSVNGNTGECVAQFMF